MIRRLASKTFVFRSFVAGLLFSLLVIPAAVLAERSVNTSTSLRTLDTSSEETRRTNNRRPVARPSVQMSVTNNYKQTGNPQTISTKIAELTDSKKTLRSVETAMQSQCSNEVVVTVLGKEITYGAGGPDVPVRVDFQLGNNPVQNLFGGENVEVGDSTTVDIGDGGEELKFIGKSAYPSFDNPTLVNYVIENSHENNALILLDGNNLAQQIASKGANGPFGGQIPIDEIIEDHLEGGMVTIPESDQLILFELGTYYQGSAAYDLQDLVLLVEHDCDVGQENIYTELNYIDPFGNGCPEGICTNGMGGALAPTNPFNGSYRSPGTFWTQSQNGFLEQVRVVVQGQNSMNNPTYFFQNFEDFAGYNFRVEIWPGFDSFAASPQIAPIKTSANLIPVNDNKSIPIGYTSQGKPNFEWVFDVSNYNFELQEGQDYILVLRALGDTQLAGWILRSGSAIGSPADVYAATISEPAFVDGPPYNWPINRIGTEIKVRTP